MIFAADWDDDAKILHQVRFEAAAIGLVLLLWLFLADKATYSGVIFAAFAALVSAIDRRYGIIPDRLIFVFSLLIGGERLFCQPTAEFIFAVFVGIAAGGLFLLLRIACRGGMGLGDVKLAFSLGLWLGWPLAAIGFVIAFWLGAVAAVFLISFRRFTLQAAIPFAPFLVLGAWLSWLYGKEIISCLLRLY